MVEISCVPLKRSRRRNKIRHLFILGNDKTFIYEDADRNYMIPPELNKRIMWESEALLYVNA